MGHIIAISNQKGGVGKTTTVINLAHELSCLKKRVLVVDADPQANATSGLAVEMGERPSLYEVMLGEVAATEGIVQTAFANLDLLPSDAALSGVQVELLSFEDHEKRLRASLAPIREKYDFVLIDTPPSLGLLTVNAFTASDSVLIPIQCEYYALEGITQLLKTIKLIKERIHPQLLLEGVLLTMYDKRTRLAQEVAENIVTHFKDKVYQTIIPRNIKLSEAPSHGLPIGLYAPESLGARCYKQFAEELLTQTQSAKLKSS